MTMREWGECLGCTLSTCVGCPIYERVDYNEMYFKEAEEVNDRLDEVADKLAEQLKRMKAGGSTPKQYGIPPGSKDLQDLIEYRDMDFAVGNIFKACYRLGLKNDRMYDLRKMKWFIDRLINIEEGEDTGRNR